MIKRNNELGEVIKRRLKVLSMSQRNLADKVGCDLSAICLMLGGRRRMSDDLRKIIGQVLSIDLSDLAQAKDAFYRGKSAITEVGVLIRDAMAKKGITQVQLCRELSIYPAYLSDVIHGRRKLGADLQLQLSTFLEVELPKALSNPSYGAVPAKTEVGVLIRDAMIKKRITQAQLCRELSIDAAILSRVIHGKRKLGADLQLELSAFLGVKFPKTEVTMRNKDLFTALRRLDSLETKMDQILAKLEKVISNE